MQLPTALDVTWSSLLQAHSVGPTETGRQPADWLACPLSFQRNRSRGLLPRRQRWKPSISTQSSDVASAWIYASNISRAFVFRLIQEQLLLTLLHYLPSCLWRQNRVFRNNKNIYLLQLGCHPVAVVILHANKTWNWLLLNLSREGYMRSM